MSDESKYYVPEIEEFHIGFEHEYLAIFPREFFPDKINTVYELISIVEESVDSPDRFRVKYLDKEDIESLGFKFESESTVGTSYKKDWIRLDTVKFTGITYSIREIRIFKLGLMDYSERVFIGDIKNKSELSRLLKQLNIL